VTLYTYTPPGRQRSGGEFFVGGPRSVALTPKIIGGFIDAYKAKLQAGNTSERIAAELAERALDVERRERELATQIVIAEQGRWYTALPRPLMAFALVIYVWKVVVWDKVLGLGSTDPIEGELATWCGAIITAYFGGRSLEKIARIWATRR
jgi:hypothetical protein